MKSINGDHANLIGSDKKARFTYDKKNREIRLMFPGTKETNAGQIDPVNLTMTFDRPGESMILKKMKSFD